MGHPASRPGSRAGRYLGSDCRPGPRVAYGALTPSGAGVRRLPLRGRRDGRRVPGRRRVRPTTRPPAGSGAVIHGRSFRHFPRSLAATGGLACCFSGPSTKMVQFPGVTNPARLAGPRRVPRRWFPNSGIWGSPAAHALPQPFVVGHALHRPRGPEASPVCVGHLPPVQLSRIPWWAPVGSNHRPRAYQARALPLS